MAAVQAEHGETLAAFDHLSRSMCGYLEYGDTTAIRVPLASLAVVFDRLGRHESAAIIAGFSRIPSAARGVPELTTAIAHLRDVLGDQMYESFAHKGKTMTSAQVVAYAQDEIVQVRTELERGG